MVLHKEFRSRRGWKELRRIMSQPKELDRRHFREAVAIIYRIATLPIERAKLNRLAKKPHQIMELMPHMSLDEAARPSPQSEN